MFQDVFRLDKLLQKSSEGLHVFFRTQNLLRCNFSRFLPKRNFGQGTLGVWKEEKKGIVGAQCKNYGNLLSRFSAKIPWIWCFLELQFTLQINSTKYFASKIEFTIFHTVWDRRKEMYLSLASNIAWRVLSEICKWVCVSHYRHDYYLVHLAFSYKSQKNSSQSTFLGQKSFFFFRENNEILLTTPLTNKKVKRL